MLSNALVSIEFLTCNKWLFSSSVSWPSVFEVQGTRLVRKLFNHNALLLVIKKAETSKKSLWSCSKAFLLTSFPGSGRVKWYDDSCFEFPMLPSDLWMILLVCTHLYKRPILHNENTMIYRLGNQEILVLKGFSYC